MTSLDGTSTIDRVTERSFIVLASAGIALLAGAYLVYLRASPVGPGAPAAAPLRATALINELTTSAPTGNRAASRREVRPSVRKRLADWSQSIDDEVAVAKANIGSSALAASLRGTAAAHAGSPAESAEAFTQSLRRDPRDVAALRGRANALSQLGRIREAADDYRALLSIVPNAAVDRYNYGVLLLRMEQPESAAEQFRRAIELRPTYDRAIYNLAALCQQQGKLHDAMALWQRFCERQPRVASAWFHRGVIWMELERADYAADCFAAAARLLPNDADLQFNLAAALRRSGRLEESLTALHRAVERQPDDLDILNLLVETHRQLAAAPNADPSHWSEAHRFAQRSLAIDPNQADLREFLQDAHAP